MEATNYNAMNIPQLRLLIANRRIQPGAARTKNDLIALLQEDDLKLGPLIIPQLTIPQRVVSPPRRAAIPVGLPTVQPQAASPPRTPPQQIRLPAMVPTAPRKVAAPIVPGITTTQVPIPQPGAATQVRMPVVPVTPQTQVRMPVVPVTPTQVRIPVVPVTPTQVQLATLAPTQAPQVRVPVVPFVGVRGAPAPTTLQRPGTPPAMPIFAQQPGSPTRMPIFGQQPITQRAPTAVRGLPGMVPPATAPTAVNIPFIPTGTLDGAIRRKLAGAQYQVYDPQWKRGYRFMSPAQMVNTGQLVGLFTSHQRYEHTDRQIIYLMEYLMTSPPNFIAEFATALGFRKLNASIDVYYNLLWFLNIARDPYAMNLDDAEKEYISGLTEAELLALLGPTYHGPTDKASLIFAALSGKSASRPDIIDIPRYPTVAAYAPSTVWKLAHNVYGLIDEENQVYSLYPPYVHVALQPPSVIETIIALANTANVDEFMTRFGIVAPTATARQLITAQDKVNYLMEEIRHYDPVFTRPQNQVPPPPLTNATKAQARATLAPYTLKEIVEAYEPMGRWGNRNGLIDVVREEGRGGSQWSWRHRYCNNDDTMNVIMADLHGDMDKDDPTDPTLSYGVQKNYRCYQASELAASWREDPEDHIFHFRVPDWVPATQGTAARIDPTTGAPLLRDFPIESIRQLRTLLQTPPAGYNVKELSAKVTEGLNAANNANILMRRLKTEYEAKPQDQQYVIQLYLAWLFVFGMWMRFWKGPGNAWPTEWVEGGGGGERCELGRRDEHVFIQQSIRTAISDAYEQYPGLKQWIENLPLLDYNFTTGEAQVATAGTTTIKTILDKIQLGDFCMAHGSDLILKTSYYLTANILNLKTGADFNGFIERMMPALFDIERQVVAYQLAQIKDRNRARERVIALEARLNDLGPANAPKPIPRQPPFNPNLIGRTGHTDPGIGYEIRFGNGDRGGF